MEIRRITENDLPKLIEFNKRVFPERENNEGYISYIVKNNPFSEEFYSYISLTDNDLIVGQVLLMPSQFRYKSIINNAYWAMDLIVDKEYRGLRIGLDLVKKSVEEKYHFGLNPTDISLKIHLICKETIVGKITKYLRVNNASFFFQLISSKKRKNIDHKYPEILKIKGGHVFSKVNNPSEINSDNGYWSDDLLEFSRNKDFLKWRFFYYDDKFAFYKMQNDKKNDKSVYFVIRPAVVRKINCLSLVDYRFNNEAQFSIILKAVREISKINKISATFTGSSLTSLGRHLKKNQYFKFGEKVDVITNFEDVESNIKDKILLTLADSDLDLKYMFYDKKQ